MSLAFKANPAVLEQEYGTKADIHYGLRVSYDRISRAIREGKIALHLIDGKVQIRIEEAVKVLLPPKMNLIP